MTHMNDQPDLIAQFAGWIAATVPQLYAPLMSVAVAVLRVTYGGGGRRQMILEGSLCGLATVAVKPTLMWIGVPEDVAVFVGAFIGLVGVEKIRDMAVRLGERKAGGQ